VLFVRKGLRPSGLAPPAALTPFYLVDPRLRASRINAGSAHSWQLRRRASREWQASPDGGNDQAKCFGGQARGFQLDGMARVVGSNEDRRPRPAGKPLEADQLLGA
jgi:hypothetical protein